MEQKFTHRLDTRNISASEKRQHELSLYWETLAKYFLSKSKFIQVVFWPNDIVCSKKDPDYISTAVGVEELEKFIISRDLIEDLHMEKIICPVNKHTIEIVLKRRENIPTSVHICHWFDISLLNEKKEVIFYSHDFGAVVQVYLTLTDEMALAKENLNMNCFIQLPENV